MTSHKNSLWNVWRNRALVAAVLIQLGTTAAVLAGKHDASGKPDIIATAVQAGSFKTLAAALGAADLVGVLQGAGPFTVLAPTDEAFAKLPAGTVESLLKPENKAKLQAILKYHVIAGRVAAKQVAGLESAKTVAGPEVKISLVDGQLRINQARVVKTDISAANGIIHVVDQVLLPPDDAKPAAGTSGVSVDDVMGLAIERGVPLFNQGNPEACAAVYEVAATSLAGRHDVPKNVRTRLNQALAESRKQTDGSARAWTLRRALDDSRQMMN